MQKSTEIIPTVETQQVVSSTYV